jgi:DNA (cytosine-5)-methyltransferase 1
MLNNYNIDELYFEVIDTFCGAGGTTTGFENAEFEGRKIAKVISCINHDENAIKSHFSNHPNSVHFVEDIRKANLDLFPKFKPNTIRVLHASLECTNFSNAKGGLPKNADSRTLADHMKRYAKYFKTDYITIENVREFLDWGELIQKRGNNGELLYDKKGNPFMIPDKSKKGLLFKKWVKEIKSLGYEMDYKILNSADYGAFTSRKRLFIIFARLGFPIVFPKPTHSKNGKNGLKKWNAVREVLDFTNEGKSIFGRKKPLCENTLKRIYAGLQKFVAQADNDNFIIQYNSGSDNNRNINVNRPINTVTTFNRFAKVNTKKLVLQIPDKFIFSFINKNTDGGKSINEPCYTITTQPQQGLVNIKKCFLSKYFSGKEKTKNIGIEEPAGSITTIDHHSLINTDFLIKYYGNEKEANSIDEPSPTITTKDRIGKIKSEFLINYNHSSNVNNIDNPAPTIVTKDKIGKVHPVYFIDEQYGKSKGVSANSPAGSLTKNPKQNLISAEQYFLDYQFSQGKKNSSIEEPAGGLTTVPKHNIVKIEKAFLFNPQYESKGGNIDDPSFTLIARMDKRPPSLVLTEFGELAILINDDDSEMTKKIKHFMAEYGIIDIKMRMLLIPELLKIQGFPGDYKLIGTQTEQKKFIGNAVETKTAKAIIESLFEAILKEYLKRKVA